VNRRGFLFAPLALLGLKPAHSGASKRVPIERRSIIASGWVSVEQVRRTELIPITDELLAEGEWTRT
jgi:hypothetical protein